MQTFIKLREDLRFAGELLAMIEVLKSATAGQFRLLQARRKEAYDFRNYIEDFVGSFRASRITHFFLTERPRLPKVVVMITSDEGFLGSLNSLVVNAGLEQAGDADELVVIGERGARYLSEMQTRAFTVLPGLSDEVAYARAGAMRDFLIEKFLSKKIGSVLVAYPRFLSLTVQQVDVRKVLPCSDLFRWAPERAAAKKTGPEPLIEPSKARVIDYLVRVSLLQTLYDMFWESKLSECAARIMHLEGSHEEIRETNRRLSYEYFKSYHARSEKHIREIFASRLKWRQTIS
jgi:ATP synthase F1 gamma subunit